MTQHEKTTALESARSMRDEKSLRLTADLAGLEKLQLMQLTLIREIQRQVKEVLGNR